MQGRMKGVDYLRYDLVEEHFHVHPESKEHTVTSAHSNYMDISQLLGSPSPPLFIVECRHG